MIGKQFSDEPSGNVAVQSASTPPSGVDRQSEPESERDQTTDLRLGRPAGPAAPSVAPAPPVAFGRYRVKNILGGGGFGVVYLGHDEQLDRPVAIKVYRGGAHSPQTEAQQFLQEARRLAQLRHPGIVAVHDVGLHDGQVYIVSDYLEGTDLADWLKQKSTGLARSGPHRGRRGRRPRSCRMPG